MDGFRLFLAVIFVAGATGQSTEPTGQFFNCHNKGQEDLCNPGTCSADGLSCDCGSTVDYRNEQDIYCVPSTHLPCQKPCSDKGTCLADVAGAEVCYCHQLYTGIDCKTPRAQATCTGDSMTLEVTPLGNFAGLIYASGFENNPNCVLADDGKGTWTGIYSLVDSQSNTCGVTKTSSNSNQAFVAKVRVQFNTAPDIYMATDQLLTFTCLFKNNVVIGSNVISVDASDSNLSPGTGKGFGRPVQLAIFLKDEAVAEEQEVVVGEKLDLRITLLKNQAFQEMLVQTCKASNLALPTSSSDLVTLDIVTDSCPVNNGVTAGNHVAKLSVNDEPMVEMSVFAFVFVKGNINLKNKLFFSCDVLLCTTGDSLCDPPACPADNPFKEGLGRRRREASEQMFTVGQGLIVRWGNQSEQAGSREGSGRREVMNDCLENSKIQTLLAVMGVVLFIFLIALTIVLVLCLRRRRQEKEVEDVKREGLSSSPAPSTFQLHLPRVQLY